MVSVSRSRETPVDVIKELLVLRSGAKTLLKILKFFTWSHF